MVTRTNLTDAKSNPLSTVRQTFDFSFYGTTEYRRTVCGFMLQDIRFGPGTSIPAHIHHRAHVSLLIEGQYKEQYGNCEVERRPDQVFLRLSGETHAIRFAASGGRAFCIHVMPVGVKRLGGYGVDLSNRSAPRGGVVVQLARLLFEQLRRNDITSRLTIEGLILEIFADLTQPERADQPSHRFRWMSKAVDFLHANCSRSISLDQVAQAAEVHPVHFARSFRQVHGCTPGEYLRRLRIDDACTKLIISDISMTDLAIESGFADHSHFSHSFRRQLGMSPTTYRKIHRRYPSQYLKSFVGKQIGGKQSSW